MIRRLLTRMLGASGILLLALAFLSSPVRTADPATASASGLVAAYGFSEASGVITTDASGNGNTGTLSNTTRVAGQTGNGVSFDGASSIVNVLDSASLDVTSGVTLEAWLNPAANTGWRTAIMKEAAGSLRYALYASTDTNRPALQAVTAGGSFDARGTTQLPLNTWTHVAMTYNGAAAKVFINGAQVTSVAASGNISISGNQLSIGGNTVWGEYFKGVIDEVRIYNRALTAAEITTDMNTAVDASGTPPTPTFTATATQAASASQIGQWSSVADWPKFAVQLALENTGDVVFWDTAGPPTSAQSWNPNTIAFTAITDASKIFCAGLATLTDGRLIVVGGHGGTQAEIGIKDTNIYNPAPKTWSRVRDMQYARWYPSTTTLADGRVLAISGSITPGVWADTPEIYNPATNTWATLSSINTSDLHDGGYPLAHVLPNGKVFVLGAGPGIMRTLDVAAQTWTNSGALPFIYGSVAMYRPGKFLYSGGGPAWDGPSQTQAAVIDASGASVTQHAVASMAYPRWQHNLVMLPDGRVLAVGGSTVINTPSTTGSLPAEIFNPTSETWSTMAAQQVPRMYHSTALLLPDGRILSTGGGAADVADSPTAEIYSPPYLFNGARPVIGAAPSFIDYTTPITIDTNDAANIATVSLIPLATETHTLDSGQTYLSLNFTKGANQLTVTPPANANVATPGSYMLFIVNSNGVPGIAKIVQVGGSAPTGTPTPTNTATPAATATRTPTPTATRTNTPTSTRTNTPTSTPVPATPSPTRTNTPPPSTATPTSTPTPTSTATSTPVPSNTPTPTPTETPTVPNTPVPTSTPTATATETPAPTDTPTSTGTTVPTRTQTATPTPIPCPIRDADVDGDGAVSVLDLALVAQHFLQTATPAPPGYDVDRDGLISILDLTAMAAMFGQSVSSCP